MNVKQLFDKSGMKISAIAEDVNLTEEYLRNIRRGRYDLPERVRGYLVRCIADREERLNRSVNGMMDSENNKPQLIEGYEYEVHYPNSGHKIDGTGYEIVGQMEFGDGWQLGKDLFKKLEK